MDFLLRNDAPFGSEQWEKIDKKVTDTARSLLIGRRFLHIYGPLGSGVQSVSLDLIEYNEDTKSDFFGDSDTSVVKAGERKFAAIPMIYKDFSISWRDLENEKQFGMPLDMAPVSAAAYGLSKKEDNVIFNGNEEFGYPGLLNINGRQIVKKGDWLQKDNPFKDVASGLELLVSNGIDGPYALVVSPDLYTQMQRVQEGTGVLVIDRVKNLVDGRLFQSNILGQNRAVLVASASHNMDVVVGQDIITAYLGPEQLNHIFRIFETILLRVKRPSAVVTFE